MQRKKLLICTIVGVMLLAVGHLPAQAVNLGKFAWQMEPNCEEIVFQVSQDNGVFALHGFQRVPAPPACPEGPAILAAYGAASPGPDGVIMLGFNIVFHDGNTFHVSAQLDPTTLNGPWSNTWGNTGELRFLGRVP